MPLLSATRAVASGKKYMSLKQVVPPLIISAIASSDPASTKLSLTHFSSAGQMLSFSQVINGKSSDKPRNNDIAA